MSELTCNIRELAACGRQYRAARMAPLGLKSCHGNYILRICADPGITQDQLAKRLFVNKSNVARQLAALEEDGFVERSPCPDDKRVMRVFPTEKALTVLPQVKEILADWEELLTGELSGEEKEALANMLEKMKDKAAAWLEEH